MSYFTNQIDERVATLLKGGKVGLLPSDTIYGLSALALNEQAVERIHKLKGRDSNKPLIVLIANIAQLTDLGLKQEHAEAVKSHWPASLSVEFEASDAPWWLHRGGFHFAVRMPDQQELRDLIAKVGPIISTSANLQGQKPALFVQEAKEIFGDELDFYMDAGNLSGQPSTLAIIENGKLKVIRQGFYKINQ